MKFFDNPITLNVIQLTGTLYDSYLGGEDTNATVTHAHISIRPSNFGDPSKFKFAQSGDDGVF